MSLLVKNLSVNLGEKQILKGINLEVKPGTIHTIMGPNGSGKSTLAQALMGDEKFKVQSSKFKVNNKDLTSLRPDERAREGLFLAFQNPVAIPGVNVANLLKTAYQVVKSKNKESRRSGIHDAVNAHSSQTASGHNPALSVWKFNELLVEKVKTLGIPQEFLRRGLNEAFSGGEKKKLEMLQAIVLSPKFAIFDEIDTGLDVDALKIVANGISQLKKQGCGILLITHYQRILKFAKPDFVHILVHGEIVESDGYKLAKEVEKNGYKKWIT